MTSNSNLKNQAREYADKHGVSYAQARREIIEASAVASQAGFEPRRVLTLQQEQRVDGVLPYPSFIDEHGFVGRQDFWRGDPFRLVGFVSDPDSFDVLATAEEFSADPQQVLGMHPVFADRRGDFATYPGPVVSTKPHTGQWAVPQSVTATYSLSDLDTSMSVGVGDLIGHLNATDFDGPVTDGKVSEEALHEMLGWCLSVRGQDFSDEYALFLAALEDGAIMSATIDVEQAQTWAAARTR